MFDKNYLNHNFTHIEYNEYNNKYSCSKCNIKIHFSFYSNYYLMDFNKNGHFIKDTLKLSCDESIIKGLLE